MDCNKTNIKRFKCLQGAAIKSKHYDKLGCVERMVVDSKLPRAEFGPNDHRKDAPSFRPRFEGQYDNFRTDHKLAVLVRWSTLHSSYNCNEYHPVF